MSYNTFGREFRFTTWGESHGPALGATVDGVPPGVPLSEEYIQRFMDRRRPGTSKHTTQRREPDQVRILSGRLRGRHHRHRDPADDREHRPASKDYGDIATSFRPGHADITYHLKYGVRDYRGGGRSSARETAARVAAERLRRRCWAAWCPICGSPATWCRWGRCIWTARGWTWAR